jgi:class 3 adenylate cyclase
MRNLNRDLDEDTYAVSPRRIPDPASTVANMPRLLAERSLAATRQRLRRPGRATSLRPETDGGPIAQAAGLDGVRSDRTSGSGQICGLFAVDIVAFAGPRRDDDIQMYIHESLYAMLRSAFDRSDVPWAHCSHEDRGDGVFVVVPPTIPAARAVLIPDRLRPLIRRHNRVSCEAARIQLRIAIHLGPVYDDGHGFIGGDVNHLFRLLDAQQFKRQLAASTAEMALITSDYLYVNLIRRQPSLMDPALFSQVNIRVKETRARAWVYLPSA